MILFGSERLSLLNGRHIEVSALNFRNPCDFSMSEFPNM